MKTGYVVGLAVGAVVVAGIVVFIVSKLKKNKETQVTSEMTRSMPPQESYAVDAVSVADTREKVMSSMKERTDEAKEVLKSSAEEMKKSIKSIDENKSEIDDLLNRLKS